MIYKAQQCRTFRVAVYELASSFDYIFILSLVASLILCAWCST